MKNFIYSLIGSAMLGLGIKQVVYLLLVSNDPNSNFIAIDGLLLLGFGIIIILLVEIINKKKN